MGRGRGSLGTLVFSPGRGGQPWAPSTGDRPLPAPTPLPGEHTRPCHPAGRGFPCPQVTCGGWGWRPAGRTEPLGQPESRSRARSAARRTARRRRRSRAGQGPRKKLSWVSWGGPGCAGGGQGRVPARTQDSGGSAAAAGRPPAAVTPPPPPSPGPPTACGRGHAGSEPAQGGGPGAPNPTFQRSPGLAPSSSPETPSKSASAR